MYRKKSIISGMVLILGAMALLTVGFLYGFTELPISKGVCASIWSGCIFVVTRIVEWIEHQ